MVGCPVLAVALEQDAAGDAQLGLGGEAIEQALEVVRWQLDVGVELADVGELGELDAGQRRVEGGRLGGEGEAVLRRRADAAPAPGEPRGRGPPAPVARATRGVASVEPSSTISQRSGGRLCAATARIVRSRWAASSRAGVISSRRGHLRCSASARPARRPGRRYCSRWRRHSISASRSEAPRARSRAVVRRRADPFDRGGEGRRVARFGEQHVVAEVALDHRQPGRDHRQAHVDVLEQLDRQQHLGEVVAQGRDDAEVGFFEPGGDLLDRRRPRRDVDAVGGVLGGERREPGGGLGVGAEDVEPDRLTLAAQQRHRPHQRLDPEAFGEAAVVDDPQLASAGARAGSRRSPKTRSSGVFITTWVRAALTPRSASSSRASGVTKTRPSASAALIRSSTRTSRTSGWRGERSKRVAKSSGKVSWKLRISGVPRSFGRQAAKTRASGMLWISTRSKGSSRSSSLTLRAAPSEEAGVAAEVGAGAAARLVRRGPVQGDRAGADRDLLGVVDADALDPVAALSQGPGLALDARVDDEVRVVDHADPQAAAARGWGRSLSYLPGLQSSRPPLTISAICESSIAGKIGREQFSEASRSATGRLPGPRPRSA